LLRLEPSLFELPYDDYSRTTSATAGIAAVSDSPAAAASRGGQTRFTVAISRCATATFATADASYAKVRRVRPQGIAARSSAQIYVAAAARPTGTASATVASASAFAARAASCTAMRTE
jgi:hypothetical protein